MTLPEISTGYRPEFGLGALYQGFNAANADQMAQEDILKQFLANQREQQIQPIDVQQAQQNLDAGQYKTSPEYQTGMRDTVSGQGMSNLAAGKTAAALQPFKQKAEETDLKNQQWTNDVQGQINQLNDMITTEPNPLTRMSAIKARDMLLSQLKETPKFVGQRELTETKTESNEYIAELKRQLEEMKALYKAQTPQKPLTMSQMEAQMRERFSANPNDEEAKQFLSEYERFRQSTQPGMGAVTINPTTKKLTTVGGNLSTQQSSTPKADPLGIR